MSAVLMLIMILRMKWSINFVLKEFQWKTKENINDKKVGSQNQTKAIQEAFFLSWFVFARKHQILKVMIGSEIGKRSCDTFFACSNSISKDLAFFGVKFLIEIKFETKMRALQNCLDFITKDHPLTLNRKWR